MLFLPSNIGACMHMTLLDISEKSLLKITSNMQSPSMDFVVRQLLLHAIQRP